MIPIVMVGVGDPVEAGFAVSLARPGGNITGLSLMTPDLVGKQLELLKEMIPYVSRVALLGNPANPTFEAVFQGRDARTAELAREMERLESQASHLVRFLATGGDSPAVRVELRAIETTLAGLRAEWATNEKASALPRPRVHPAWVISKLEHLDALLQRDPRPAKVEILKHLDGDLVIVPRPSSPGERRAEISGRAKGDSLLRDQEAVCLQVVAGAGFEPATFGL